MTLEEYQEFVGEAAHFEEGILKLVTHRQNTIKFLRLGYVSGKLNGEAGEFVEEVQKSLRDSGGDITDRREAMIDELGDVQWYVTAACIELGITLEELMDRNKIKLDARKKKRAKKNGRETPKI